jgi:hypothetical protein
MEIGKKKGSFRLRLIDLENGQSKTITIYRKDSDKKTSLDELMKKLINSLRTD